MISVPSLEPLNLGPAPIFLLNDNPVPGKPALNLRPEVPLVIPNPRPPSRGLAMRFPKFSRASPPNDIDFLNRNPMAIFLSAQCSYVMSLSRRSKPTSSSASSKRRKFSGVGLVVGRRRNFSLPIATYLHSQRFRLHRRSGKRGTVLPGYSLPNCPTTPAHGFGPGRMRTPRNRPSLCAFRNARSERAI